MVYIKTIFSEEYELKYIKLQLHESFGYADDVIVTEYNYTHVGKKREFCFQKALENGYFTDAEKERIIYLPIDVTQEVYKIDELGTLTGEQMHYNEQLFRGAFVKEMKLNDKDIIISVDADEIIYRRCYEKLLYKMKHDLRGLLFPSKVCFCMKLHQFYYRPDYYWENCEFIAPSICYAVRHKKDYPAQWRYEGKLIDGYCGCHFSWVLTVEDMVKKLNNYAHNDLYHSLANKDLLVAAIRNKEYPFDPEREFNIREVDCEKDSALYPETYSVIKQEFDEMLEHQFD